VSVADIATTPMASARTRLRAAQTFRITAAGYRSMWRVQVPRGAPAREARRNAKQAVGTNREKSVETTRGDTRLCGLDEQTPEVDDDESASQHP